METEKWYVKDNFVTKKREGYEVIAECKSHTMALEITDSHNKKLVRRNDEKTDSNERR